jgi:phosphoribosyl 1,2-cyclic phosphate phosphodiesterase
VLIHTPPELRLLLAAAGPTHLDAVLISHDHADQIHGFDDIRAFFLKQRRQIPTFIDASTRASFMQRFGYAFRSEGGYPAIADDAGAMTPLAPVLVDGPGGPLEIIPLEQDHGFSKSLGFRAGDVAYSNDLVAMPEKTFAALDDTPHPTHAHVGRALEWIERLKPRHAVLTNMHIDLDYQALKARLPAGVEPGYDGWARDYPI